MEFLQNLTQYHWLSFAFLILIFEIIGVGGFMLGFSLAGIIVFITMSIADISWQLQFIIFAICSVVFSVAWYLYQNKKDKADEQTTSLNKKESQLLGQTITLEDAIVNGKGRVKIADTTWSVYSEEDLKIGDKVKVVKVNGILLQIEKVK